MGPIIIDSCVFIQVLRGDRECDTLARSRNGMCNTVVYLELMQGARNKREYQVIKRFLNDFPLITLSDQAQLLAIQLMETYGSSHGLRLPDALMAAHVLELKLPLWTLNIKDFQFIKGIVLI